MGFLMQNRKDMEKSALDRIHKASELSFKIYQQPLVVCYSGGKDSDVLLSLYEKSGVPFEVLHSLTTADAPENRAPCVRCVPSAGRQGD